jgi:HAD superfamily hydrolase (TIGR01509 family)
MISQVRAIAWDIDGTLIDSEPLHEVVLNEVCAAYGADLSDLPENHFRGIHMPDVWTEVKPRMPATLTETEWAEAIVALYVERANELRPLADAVAVMRTLAQAGIRQVCVSNSGRRVVDANLAALGILDLIDFSISLDDVSDGKPHPEPYLAASQRLGIPVEAMAAVEDSIPGATSAREAGLRVFGLVSPGGEPIGPAHVTMDRLIDLPALVLSPAMLAT